MDGGAGKKKFHDGCGARQPTIRRDGLKFVATFKAGMTEVNYSLKYTYHFLLFLVPII
jgi:hypothetical protein